MRDRTTSVNPLDPRLDNVLFDVWLLSRATTAWLDEVLAPSSLDSDEFAMYSVLRSRAGMTPSELAHWMSAPATTVSSYVKRFEAKGHLERSPNPDDGRSYLLHLTPAGRRAHAAAGKLFLPMLDRVNDRVGPRVDETHERLRDLHATIAALRDET